MSWSGRARKGRADRRERHRRPPGRQQVLAQLVASPLHFALADPGADLGRHRQARCAIGRLHRLDPYSRARRFRRFRFNAGEIGLGLGEVRRAVALPWQHVARNDGRRPKGGHRAQPDPVAPLVRGPSKSKTRLYVLRSRSIAAPQQPRLILQITSGFVLASTQTVTMSCFSHASRARVPIPFFRLRSTCFSVQQVDSTKPSKSPKQS